jgi:hypothetical protein
MVEPEVIDANGTTELAAQPNALLTLTADQINKAAEAITARTEAHKKLIQACAKFTVEEDWTDFGGKPYLEGAGASRLVRSLGLSVSAPIFDIEQRGEDFFVECMVSVGWPAMGVPAITQIGDCSTRDKFFDSSAAKSIINQHREQAGGDEALARRMLQPDIKKKALSNALSRAVSDLLGIRGLPAQYLADLGFKIKGIKFKEGATKTTAQKAKTRKKETGKEVSIAEVNSAAEGSVVSVRGVLVSTKNNDKSNVYILVADDNKTQTRIYQRTANPPHEWATPGVELYCSGVEITEHKGYRYNWADNIELTEAGGGTDEDGPADDPE